MLQLRSACRCMGVVVTLGVALTLGSLGAQATTVVSDASPHTLAYADQPSDFSFDVTCTVDYDGTGYTYDYVVYVAGSNPQSTGQGAITWTGNAHLAHTFYVTVGDTVVTDQGADTSFGGLTYGWTPLGVSPTGELIWYAGSIGDAIQGRTEGQQIGHFWFTTTAPPELVPAIMENGSGWQAQGTIHGPATGMDPQQTGATPELPSLLLLLTSGAPMLGIGYLRRKTTCAADTG